MSASPFILEACHHTRSDGSRQDGWRVVKLVTGKPHPVPLCEPWYGVYSKQMAAAFLDGVLLVYFSHQRVKPRTPRPRAKQPSRKAVKEPVFN